MQTFAETETGTASDDILSTESVIYSKCLPSSHPMSMTSPSDDSCYHHRRHSLAQCQHQHPVLALQCITCSLPHKHQPNSQSRDHNNILTFNTAIPQNLYFSINYTQLRPFVMHCNLCAHQNAVVDNCTSLPYNSTNCSFCPSTFQPHTLHLCWLRSTYVCDH